MPAVLTFLKHALRAALPDQSDLLSLVPELPPAHAFLIVELWVSILLVRNHRLQAYVLVSPPIWTGTDLLVLLASYRDPAVGLAGCVGVLLNTQHTALHEAEAVPLPHLQDAWSVTPWLTFDPCPRCDRLGCSATNPPALRVCGAMPKGSTVT